MDFASLSHTFQVSPISTADLDELLILCQTNPLFYQHCPPEPSLQSLQSDLLALPKGKSMEDKFYLGFRKSGKLAAVLDLIVRYPNEQTAFWGFFMLRCDLQGKGIGTALVQEICSALSREYDFIRLGYVESNPQSRHFWLKNGFKPTGVIVPAGDYRIVLMQKTLKKA